MKRIYSLFFSMILILTALNANAQNSHPGVRYDGSITIELYNIPTVLDNQSVYIVEAADGQTCDFTLYNFSLDGESVMGDIEVNNVKITTENGVKSYVGAKEGLRLGEGDDAIIADCKLDGTEQPDGTLLMNIHVAWLMIPGDHSHDVPIEVTFSGKKASGQTSEIESVEAAQASVVKIYNVNGVELQAPAKGLNIVVLSDGTTRKVIVK